MAHGLAGLVNAMIPRWLLPSVILVLLCGSSFAGVDSSDERAPVPPDPGGVITAVDGDPINRLATAVYPRFAAAGKGNLIFSPSGYHAALAMALLGARGATERELAEALGLPVGAKARAEWTIAWRLRMEEIRRSGDTVLDLTGQFRYAPGFPLRPSFAEALKRMFGASAIPADAAADTDGLRREIAKQAGEATGGMIREVGVSVPANAGGGIAVVQTIHLNGVWEHPFAPDDTRKAPFHCDDGRAPLVPLMEIELDSLLYGERDGVQACVLPYRGDLSMTVLLPPAGGLPLLEANLAARGCDRMLAGMARRTVRVALPRFRFESETAADEVLSGLGLDAACDGSRADFSGMSERRGLFLAAVRQKAVVEVDERGTRAAAVTSGFIALGGEPPKPIVFRADRPFLFLIRDDPSGAILFMGRFSEPAGP